MTDPLAVVLCEARNASDAQRRRERELADALAARPGVELAVLPHLYDLAPGGPGFHYLQSLGGHFAVLGWLYPRAAYWILHANGVEGRMGPTAFFPDEEVEAVHPTHGTERPDRIIWCLDLRGPADVAEIVSEIERIAAGGAARVAAGHSHASPIDARHRRVEETVLARWYPVIDFRRCENCLECLNFCLFGVFGLDEAGRIFVEQSDACRDGCPACSRICPPGAILFPEHPDGAIAGDPSAPPPEGGFHVDFLDGPSQAEPREPSGGRPPPHGIPHPAALQRKDGLDRLLDELDGTEL
jgi:NAD-dependent dihydropyrimidine dehydrogenase PreA subunit